WRRRERSGQRSFPSSCPYYTWWAPPLKHNRPSIESAMSISAKCERDAFARFEVAKKPRAAKPGAGGCEWPRSVEFARAFGGIDRVRQRVDRLPHFLGQRIEIGIDLRVGRVDPVLRDCRLHGDGL